MNEPSAKALAIARKGCRRCDIYGVTEPCRRCLLDALNMDAFAAPWIELARMVPTACIDVSRLVGRRCGKCFRCRAAALLAAG